MFRKIRNRILLLNMVMVSSVVIVAFGAIFAATYLRVRSENNEKLLHGSPSQQMLVFDTPFIREGALHPRPWVGGIYTARISPDAGLSFSLLVDSQANVVDISSMMDLPSETYTRLAAQSMGTAGGTDTITLEGRTWQYRISPVTVTFNEVIGRPFAAAFTVTGEYSHIRFLDVTDSYQMLRALALTLFGLTAVLLAVFFAISRHFANRAVKPMEEAWEKQRRFISDASHELKTPLSVINANCGVLYSGKEDTVESQLKWVDSIMRATVRMTGLVNSLLSLAGMEEARLAPQKYIFDMCGAVDEAVSEIEAAALEKGLTIHRNITSGTEIESDREQICKILAILFDNAVKYADCGGEVTALLKKEKRHVICSVRNSGEGIPPEELPRLFDRFYRGDPARSSENSGYGLGLAIAKAIADQLGASLTAESVLGEYTEFRLVFEAIS
jgi:signal transduction histidine kinase